MKALVSASLAPAGLPVHRWLPDDLGGIPCVAVGRTSVETEPSLPGSWVLRSPVFVFGDRNVTPDNQDELDQAAWKVLQLLLAIQPQGDILDVTVTGADPRVTPVGRNEYPTYVIDVVATTTRVC